MRPMMILHKSEANDSVMFSLMCITCSVSWAALMSPITADFVSGAEKRLGATAVDDLGRLFWLEFRPLESGVVEKVLINSLPAAHLDCRVLV
ncbi:hypothetical protein Vadar_023607 [Vaccinium darrowii]|uniref:Uncharacterized protein n=1 Tax=Vaccinium darrowii TaxID=229202 RepID=A0ACB7Y9X5_9ERIC|nr:hypothetical protein Vadar_023607 [Vaccinium darrowii]